MRLVGFIDDDLNGMRVLVVRFTFLLMACTSRGEDRRSANIALYFELVNNTKKECS